MYTTGGLSSDLLKITNNQTWGSPEGPDLVFQCLVLPGILSILGLICALGVRLYHAEDLNSEIASLKQRISRIFQGTFITRLCLLQVAIVIPLIFYVNTKEHYWTSKHTTMLFMGVLSLASWLTVFQRAPRFRVVYAWPMAFILTSATMSSFASVNIPEGSGYLFAIFGSALYCFLSLQVFSTSKRIHLLITSWVIVAIIVSTYAFAQSYLLLPQNMVYAMETRAPVSTIGNKNYACYFLDLTLPMAFALAASRRSPLQTLLALAVYVFCRWHFVLCDSRAGTISMVASIALTFMVLFYYDRKRIQMLLYVVLLEPLLWVVTCMAEADYNAIQSWGQMLLQPKYRGAIGDSLIRVLPENLQQFRGTISQWFMQGNEYFLGIPSRLPALVLGVIIALGVFYYLIIKVKDWTIHLSAAGLLAFLPYLLSVMTMPGNVPPNRIVSEVVAGLQRTEIGNLETAVEVLNKYGTTMATAAGAYNKIMLVKHLDVSALVAFNLFIVMALFLLFRWYDRKEGWLPSLSTMGSIFAWYLVFIVIHPADKSLIERLFGELFYPLQYAWPIGVGHFHSHHPMLSLFFKGISLVLFSLVSISCLIMVFQFIPAKFTEERSRILYNNIRTIAKAGGVVIVLILLVGLWFHPRIVRTRTAIINNLGEQGFVNAVFRGFHAYFNTQGEFVNAKSDGPVGFRLEIYQGTMRKMRDNPILGIGPGNFKVIHPYPKYETALERRILGKEVLGRKAHNDFLEDAAENGFFGLMGLIWMFSMTGYLFKRTLDLFLPEKNKTDVFLNTITWGLCWSMTAILVHAQFEAPLLQPASTYPVWMLFGVVYQLNRIHRQRGLVREVYPQLAQPSSQPLQIGSASAVTVPSVASYELPPAKPLAQMPRIKPVVAWPVLAAVVTLLMGSVLIRQYAGEMWLRWGMIFSESGIEQYRYVFEALEKSSAVYPQEMETNYILGRYCIDAISKAYRPWHIKTRTDLYSDEERKESQEEIAYLLENYQLDANRILDFANLGIQLHKRDLFMNPNYKWAHNNMGVLYDKLAQIYDDLAAVEKSPEKKKEYNALARQAEEDSKNCYAKALEIDDLQVYALFNLGVGAYREMQFDLALKYFQKTLLADPSRGDVHVFIAKCQVGLERMDRAMDAIENLFAWSESNRRPIRENDKRDVEDILYQIGRYSLKVKDSKLTMRSAKMLTKNFSRCEYLPLLARGTVDSGSAEGTLELVAESLEKCKDRRPSADLIYAQAKAYALLNDPTLTLDTLDILLSSNAASTFKPIIEAEPVFETIRASTPYQEMVGSHSATELIPAATAGMGIIPATP